MDKFAQDVNQHIEVYKLDWAEQDVPGETSRTVWNSQPGSSCNTPLNGWLFCQSPSFSSVLCLRTVHYLIYADT